MKGTVTMILSLLGLGAIGMGIYMTWNTDRAETKYFKDPGLYIIGLTPPLDEEADVKPGREVCYRATYEDGRVVRLEQLRSHAICWQDWVFSYDDEGRLKKTESHYTPYGKRCRKIWRVTARAFNDAGLPVHLEYERLLPASDGKRETSELLRRLEFSYDNEGRFSTSNVFNENGSLRCSVRLTYTEKGEFERMELYDRDGKLKKKSKYASRDYYLRKAIEFQAKSKLREIGEIQL